MFPEGEAYIGHCFKCDTPVIFAYVNGMKEKLDTVSVKFTDAIILTKHWHTVVQVWKDWNTENNQGKAIKFHAAAWASLTPPTKGRLYVRHLCRIKRKATKHGNSRHSA